MIRTDQWHQRPVRLVAGRRAKMLLAVLVELNHLAVDAAPISGRRSRFETVLPAGRISPSGGSATVGLAR